MAQYYYTVSALPSLSFEEETVPSFEDFLSFCDDTLEPADSAILHKAALHGSGEAAGNATVEAWNRWELSLRAEIAKARAGKKGLETELYARYGIESQYILDTARSAFGDPSPASAEDTLLKAYWRRLDELEVGHHFDIDKLVVYYLRLQILDVKKRRNKPDGEKNFSLLYESIMRNQST